MKKVTLLMFHLCLFCLPTLFGQLNVDNHLTITHPTSNASIFLNAENYSTEIGLQDNNEQGFYVRSRNKYRFSVNQNGNVAIGAILSDHPLFVTGTAEGALVRFKPNKFLYPKSDGTGWPDPKEPLLKNHILMLEGHDELYCGNYLTFKSNGDYFSRFLNFLDKDGENIAYVNSVGQAYFNRLTLKNDLTIDSGIDNNGKNAAISVRSGNQLMLIDGNEIDGNSGIYLNRNTQKNVIAVPDGGKVGIGNNKPEAILDVGGSSIIRGAINLKRGNGILLYADGKEALWSNGKYFSWGYGQEYNFFDKPVNIGTNVEQKGYKLSVFGRIKCTEVRVSNTHWADFVFAEDYPLRPLAEVEQFIQSNKHLPDVPSEAEVLEKGTDLGKMDAILLQKIEELTLYVIDLKKENETLKKRMDQLDNTNSRK